MLTEGEAKTILGRTLEFLQFSDRVFALSQRLAEVKFVPPSRGGPKQERLSAGNIAAWTTLAVHVAAGSFKRLEGMLSSIEVEGTQGALFVLKHMQVFPCSDAAIELRLSQIDLPSLSDFVRSTATTVEELGAFRSPRTPVGKVIAVVDGSYFFSGMWGCALIIAGQTDILVDFEPYTKIGREWHAAYKILKRNLKFLKEKVDILCADALYWREKMLKLCVSAGIDFTVRVSEKDDKDGKLRTDYRRVITEMKSAIEYKRKKGENPKGKTVREKKYDHENAASTFRATVHRVSGLEYTGIPVYMYRIKGKWKQGRKETDGESFIMSTLSDISSAVGSAIARSRVEELFDRIKNTYRVKADFVYKGDTKTYNKAEVGKAFAKFRRLMLCAAAAINMSSFFIWMTTSKRKEVNAGREVLMRRQMEVAPLPMQSKTLLETLHEDAVLIKRLSMIGYGKLLSSIIAQATGGEVFQITNSS